MKKRLIFIAGCLVFAAVTFDASAFQLKSQRELGTGEGRNQNVVVRCTTAAGQVSNQTCALRRFARCVGDRCDGWHPWTSLRDPNTTFNDWRAAASACCQSLGLR